MVVLGRCMRCGKPGKAVRVEGSSSTDGQTLMCFVWLYLQTNGGRKRCARLVPGKSLWKYSEFSVKNIFG